MEGIGAVCDYSLFEFEVYGDEQYGSAQPGDAGASALGETTQSTCRAAEKPSGGKLEKSFLNFKQAHPNYEASAGGLSMFNRLNAFKEIR